MKKYDIAIFDVDGTLLDTTEGVLASVEYTISKYGLKPLERDQLLSFIGPPIQNSLKKYYGFPDEILQELAETFRERYKNYELLKAVPYEGIYDVCDALYDADIRLAVATYKREDYAIELLKHFHFDKYTNILYGADNLNKLKKKDIILKCMSDSRVSDCSKAVMIGDSDNDAIGAAALKMNFIGVTYGFGFTKHEDIKCFSHIGIADNPKEISSYFI